MTLALTAVYDGAVFRPREPVELQPDTECMLTIESLSKNAIASTLARDAEGEFDALTAIAAMAVEMGITDLADRHHEYAHPVPPEE